MWNMYREELQLCELTGMWINASILSYVNITALTLPFGLCYFCWRDYIAQ